MIPSARKRLFAFGAVGGVVLAAGHFMGELPEERTVEVRVADDRIDRIELTWQEDDETVHRTLLAPPFERPKSPVRLSDGPHRLQLSVQRGAESSYEERHVDVAEGAATIVIDVP